MADMRERLAKTIYEAAFNDVIQLMHADAESNFWLSVADAVLAKFDVRERRKRA